MVAEGQPRDVAGRIVDNAKATQTQAPTIYQALAAVMADVGHVSKLDRNNQQGFNFRGIDAVVNAVGPALRSHGVIVVPQIRSVDYEPMPTKSGTVMTACRVQVKYVFYGPAGDCIESSVAGEAFDAGDKSTPKAMSVAFRTALLQSLALPTDEPDPDAATYERAEHQVAPPDPLNAAKARVKVAWEHTRGTFDSDALRAHYEQTYAQPLDDATPEQLNAYAVLLETETP